MPLEAGTTLGPYKIVAQIGAGGMGEVYRARDTKLDRDVALKILPEDFAADPERLARFQREAKVLASLNHPNIAAIYGLEDRGETHALVLELVEGPTLQDRIAQGAIPLDEALPIARQIAEALEAAHEQGIIHRDLKPANVKVTPAGMVKVLDFGLAKALTDVRSAGASAPATDADLAASPTMSMTAATTRMGMILGTAAYMSPEQARGKPVDKRTDIWAFGAVLYEMLTGSKPFPGDDISQTLARVVEREPDWDGLATKAPATLRRCLQLCLAKDSRHRIRDMGDVRLALEGAFHVGDAAGSSSDVPIWQRPAGVALAGVAGALLAGLTAWALVGAEPPAAPGVIRFTIPADTFPLGLLNQRSRDLTLSPSGDYIVYRSRDRAERPMLRLRHLDRLSDAPLDGTQGASFPFVSPDGRWVGFVVQGETDSVWKVPHSGGSPVRLADSPRSIWGASWGTDDHVYLGTTEGLRRVPSDGGVLEALTTVDSAKGERFHGVPFVMASRGVVFFQVAGSAQVSQLAVLELESGVVARLGVEGHTPHYLSSGHLVYVSAGGSLQAVPFDVESLAGTGSPVPLIDDVNVKLGPVADFAVSDAGHLAYVVRRDRDALTNLVLVGGDGTPTLLADIEGSAWFPRFSPDGARVAFGQGSFFESFASEADLWVIDVTRGARTRVTFGGNNRFYPVWSSDGTHLTHADSTNPTNRLLWTSADGNGATETLLEVDGRRFPTSWSPDGRFLALNVGPDGTPTNSRDIWMLDMGAAVPTPAPFVETPFAERGAIFSPDGAWVAYVSDKSGQNDVFVRPFPGPGAEITVSVNGGQEPVWAPSGRELFYRNATQLLAVAVDSTGSSLVVGESRRVFDDPYMRDGGGAAGGVANYDVSPSGDRFVMVADVTGNDGTRDPVAIHVVANWLEELQARVPTR